MIATSGKSRTRVAADVYARDYGHLLESTDCVVLVRRWKAEALAVGAGVSRPYCGDMDIGHMTLHTTAPCDRDRMRRTAHGNKRLSALLDIAFSTDSNIFFGGRRGADIEVHVDCDITCTSGRRPETLEAAARWMRTEHSQAVAGIMGRAQGGCPDFRIDYPADPAACILAVESSFADIATWVNAMRLDTQRSHLGSIAAIQELLNGIPAKRLSKGQAKRLNEARAIAGRLLKAA